MLGSIYLVIRKAAGNLCGPPAFVSTHPKRVDGGDPNPIPSGGEDAKHAHTHARDTQRTPSRRDVSRKGGGRCGQHAEMAEAHRSDIDVSSPTSVGTVPLKELV